MKRSIVFGSVVILLGLLIAMGPQFLFKVCAIEDDDIPHCRWSAQAEIGMGLLIAALGICMMVFTDPKTHLGLSIGIFFSGIIALFIPHALIGGCGSMAMACRSVGFPAITVESVVLLVFSVAIAVYCEMKKPSVTNVF